MDEHDHEGERQCLPSKNCFLNRYMIGPNQSHVEKLSPRAKGYGGQRKPSRTSQLEPPSLTEQISFRARALLTALLMGQSPLFTRVHLVGQSHLLTTIHLADQNRLWTTVHLVGHGLLLKG